MATEHQHPKIIFFDLDGTLWDFRTNAIASLKELFEQHRLNRFFADFADFHHRYAPCNHRLWDEYARGEITKDFLMVERFASPLREVGVTDDALVTTLSQGFFTHLAEKRQLMPHAIEVLEVLNNKYCMAIVSNGFPEIQFKKLENASLLHYFKYVILSEQVGAPKPNPLFFDAAMKICHCKPSDVILVGDEYATDIVGAHNYGIPTVWYNPQNMTAEKPVHDFEINDLNALLTILL